MNKIWKSLTKKRVLINFICIALCVVCIVSNARLGGVVNKDFYTSPMTESAPKIAIKVNSEEEVIKDKVDRLNAKKKLAEKQTYYYKEDGFDPVKLAIAMIENGDFLSFPGELWTGNGSGFSYSPDYKYISLGAFSGETNDLTGRTLPEKEEEIQQMVDQVIQEADLTTGTDAEKAYKLSTYIVRNYKYKTGYYSMYDFLKYKKGVCMNASQVTCLILNKVGVRCMCLAAEGEDRSDPANPLPFNHMWNYVEIEGEWYFYDNQPFTWGGRPDIMATEYTAKGMLSSDPNMCKGKCKSEYTYSDIWDIFFSEEFQKRYPLAKSDYDPLKIRGCVEYNEAQKKKQEEANKKETVTTKKENGVTITTKTEKDGTKTITESNGKTNDEKVTIVTKKDASGKVTSKTAVSGNVKYKINGSRATVVKASTKKATAVHIKDIVMGKKTYKVTKIKESAFKGNTHLRKVIWGNGTCPKKIPANAFKGCKNLKTVMIKGTQLKRVGKGAFSGIKKNAVFYLPTQKAKAYQKYFTKKAGCKKTMKLKKKAMSKMK